MTLGWILAWATYKYTQGATINTSEANGWTTGIDLCWTETSGNTQVLT